MAEQHHSNQQKAGGATVLIVGLCLIGYGTLHNGTGGMAFAGYICIGVGLLGLAQTFLKSRQLPKKELMRLAEQRKGILTLSEIATALNIEPEIARRTLQALAKDGIAIQRWEEFRKNLWEFPDYMKLPITESIELAKAKGGRLSMQDLLNSGHSADVARQTLDTLSDKGLAHQDPATRDVIVTTQ
ncbi:MAG TPA: hypothetical protein VHM90_04805 [Phycisphaerae bacterium]|nr:hypothetical protein [Phycisphaerae bacterium]